MTTGDADKVAPVEQIGGTGIYVSALRDALLADEIDIAVHSLRICRPGRSTAWPSARSRSARTRATCSSPGTA